MRLSRTSCPCRSTRPGCEQAGTPAGSMTECSCCIADELVLVPPGGAGSGERSWPSWPCRTTRPGCDQPGTPAGSMNEVSCYTADELVLAPSGGAPGRVASTARRHMPADNAGVKRLNYTRESIPAAGGHQFDLVAVRVIVEGDDAGAVQHATGLADCIPA